MEHPLRCIVFEIQSHTNLWKRNGLEVSFPLQFYRQPAWTFYSYDLDILLIQLCTMSIASYSPQIVIESLINKFDLDNYFNFKRLSKKSWKTQSEYIEDEKLNNLEKIMYEIDDFGHYLAAQLFRLIILLCSPANSMFMNHEEMIRREVMHNLCAADCSFTQLEDKLSVDHKKNYHGEFEKILNEIADYKQPNYHEQGCYSLKQEYWQQFDPFFYHYRPDILTKANERYKVKTRNELLLWQEQDKLIQNYGNNHPLYPLIGNLLFCNQLHAILYTVIYTAMHETLYMIRSSYYNSKISVLHPSNINNYVQLILDNKLFTVKDHLNTDTSHHHHGIPPENDKSILNLQNILPILRIIWLSITTDSTYKQQRAERLQYLNQQKHNQFKQPLDNLSISDNHLVVNSTQTGVEILTNRSQNIQLK